MREADENSVLGVVFDEESENNLGFVLAIHLDSLLVVSPFSLFSQASKYTNFWSGRRVVFTCNILQKLAVRMVYYIAR